jgi:hypothetical protein
MPDPHGGMLRLADLPREGPPIDVSRQLDAVGGIEQEYRDVIAPGIQSGGQGMLPSEFFNWSQELRTIRPQIQGLEQWDHIEQQLIIPQVNRALQTVSRHMNEALSEQWDSWRNRYVQELPALLRGLRREATELSRSRAATVARAINPLLPEPRRSESLSRKALWILTGTPGITCVLNGMRTPQYVDDALAVLRWAPFTDSMTLYEHLKSTAIR